MMLKLAVFLLVAVCVIYAHDVCTSTEDCTKTNPNPNTKCVLKSVSDIRPQGYCKGPECKVCGGGPPAELCGPNKECVTVGDARDSQGCCQNCQPVECTPGSSECGEGKECTKAKNGCYKCKKTSDCETCEQQRNCWIDDAECKYAKANDATGCCNPECRFCGGLLGDLCSNNEICVQFSKSVVDVGGCCRKNCKICKSKDDCKKNEICDTISTAKDAEGCCRNKNQGN